VASISTDDADIVFFWRSGVLDVERRGVRNQFMVCIFQFQFGSNKFVSGFES
jgi:hypothetical protein